MYCIYNTYIVVSSGPPGRICHRHVADTFQMFQMFQFQNDKYATSQKCIFEMSHFSFKITSMGCPIPVSTKQLQIDKYTTFQRRILEMSQISFKITSMGCHMPVSQIQFHRNLNAMYLIHAFETSWGRL